jgi:hypothetical protein
VELFDEETQTFITTKEHTLQLEHSLVSISKWEAKWCKSFFLKEAKTLEETIDYIKCMTITQNVNPDVYRYMNKDNVDQINDYINAPMTATTFPQSGGGNNSEITTSELIYYWMISHNIPMECQKWHINRLLTLIRVCSVKNAPPKKMGRGDIMRRNAALNAARRKKLNSSG